MIFDAVGNLISKRDFEERTTTYEYTLYNQLKRKAYPDNTSVSFTYTPNGNKETITDARGGTLYEYTARGLLKKVMNPDSSMIEYEYDLSGNRTLVKTTVNSVSNETHYAFDPNNRLELVTDSYGRNTSYTFDDVGNKKTMTYPNGIFARYTYDAMSRLKKIENLHSDNSAISTYDYILSPSGNRTRMTENTGRITNWSYDQTYRLLSEDIINPGDTEKILTYSYDPVGNRLTKTEDGAITNYSYDENDRLTSENGITYSWDRNGNMLSKTENGITMSYAWDSENRLIGIQSPSNTINYAYDSNGIRVQTNANGAITNYLIDDNRDYAQVLEERDANNNLIAGYEYGDDLISQIRSDQFSYYHYDAIGSTRSLTDNEGIATDTYNYEAFGNMLQRTGSTANNYLFVGEQFDPYAELNYFRARYYDPRNGLFNSMDPIKPCACCPQNSSYAYANQNPVNNLDYSGKFTLMDLLIVATIIAGILLIGEEVINLYQEHRRREKMKELQKWDCPTDIPIRCNLWCGICHRKCGVLPHEPITVIEACFKSCNDCAKQDCPYRKTIRKHNQIELAEPVYCIISFLPEGQYYQGLCDEPLLYVDPDLCPSSHR